MSRAAQARATALVFACVFGAVVARPGLATDCEKADAVSIATGSPGQALTASSAEANACRIGADSVEHTPWTAALVVDLRRPTELEGVHIPNAVKLRRTDVDSLVVSAAGLPVLLVGSGLDDASLAALCARLAAQHAEPVALVSGGLPAWAAAGRPLLLPPAESSDGVPSLMAGTSARAALAPRQRVSQGELLRALANPEAHVLNLGSDFEFDADASAHTAEASLEQTTAAAAVEATRTWLSTLSVDRSGPLIVIAEARPGVVAALTQLSASQPEPFWVVTFNQAERAAREQQLAHRPDTTPLRPETCAWN